MSSRIRQTEILFLHLFLRLLDNGGRGAVIVPDGILFGSSNAHVEARRKLIEENRLDAVVSMPSGVFRPYASVSTAILIFTKGAKTDRIWFYDMEHDGFSLDDKRQKVPENDIHDVLACWKNRKNADFIAKRSARLNELKEKIAPLKTDRIKHHEIIHRLKFEEIVAHDPDKARTAREKAESELAELQAQIAPLQAEISRLHVIILGGAGGGHASIRVKDSLCDPPQWRSRTRDNWRRLGENRKRLRTEAQPKALRRRTSNAFDPTRYLGVPTSAQIY